MNTKASTMENLRRRTPFMTQEDEMDKEGRIVMDEQEQEEIINNIREDVQQSNERLRFVLRTFLVLSALIQIASLFYPSTFIDGKPISGARVFIFLNITLHLILSVSLFPELRSWSQQHATETYQIFQSQMWCVVLVSALSPVASALSGRSWLQTMWWSITHLLIVAGLLAIRWITEAEHQTDELEKLMYDAKGA